MVIKASTTRRNKISKAIRDAIPSRKNIYEGIAPSQRSAAYFIVGGISVLFVLIALSITAAVSLNTRLQQQLQELQAGGRSAQDFDSCGENGTIIRTAEGELCITEDGTAVEPTPTATPEPDPVLTPQTASEETVQPTVQIPPPVVNNPNVTNPESIPSQTAGNANIGGAD